MQTNKATILKTGEVLIKGKKKQVETLLNPDIKQGIFTV